MLNAILIVYCSMAAVAFLYFGIISLAYRPYSVFRLILVTIGIAILWPVFIVWSHKR